MIEIWKPVVGYEELYEVSNFGNIKSLCRLSWNGHSFILREERILKTTKNPNGYLQIILSKNNKQKTFFIHRIITHSFIPNPENKPQVNHKNGDKLDNRIENLEWATSSENLRHKIDILGYKDSLETRFKKSISKIGKNNPAFKHGKRINSHKQNAYDWALNNLGAR
jgi:hypothetical protein